MLLTMRRTEEPHNSRVKIKEEEPENYYKAENFEENLGWREELADTGLVCSPETDGNEDAKRKPTKKRSFVRQFGVENDRQESEYVDITQVQQLLLDSATSSGKVASGKNRSGERQDCQQLYEATNRCLTFSEEAKTPLRSVHRPHSQPSSSSFFGSPQPLLRSPERYYPHQTRQLDYFVGKVQSPSELTPKPRMLAEGLPHLQPPAPQTGGHSPNVEELFALWFGNPSGNAGWFLIYLLQTKFQLKKLSFLRSFL